MSIYNGATLLITGGTGSFGNTVLKHFLTSDIGQIRIFSRDEKKQDDIIVWNRCYCIMLYISCFSCVL